MAATKGWAKAQYRPAQNRTSSHIEWLYRAAQAHPSASSRLSCLFETHPSDTTLLQPTPFQPHYARFLPKGYNHAASCRPPNLSSKDDFIARSLRVILLRASLKKQSGL